MKLNIKHSVLFLILNIWFLVPNQLYAEDWSYKIEPYLMFISIDGDASLGRATGADVDVGFDDILENLKFAAMLHYH